MDKKKQKKPRKRAKKVEEKEEVAKPINQPNAGYPQKRVGLRDVGDTRVRKTAFMDSKDMKKKTGEVKAIHPKREKVIHPKKGK